MFKPESIRYSSKGPVEVEIRMAFEMKLCFDDKKNY